MAKTFTYKADAGETLCQLAVRFGFTDCDRLRPHNPHIPASRGRLDQGEEVQIPERKKRTEHGAVEQRHVFSLDLEQLPRIEFIYESGRGYGVDTQDHKPRPDLDPKRSELAISNHVVDRGGDGTVPGNFPDENFFGYNADASADPDHFKVQVFAPRLPDTQQRVRVNLYAMRPALWGPSDLFDETQEIRVHPHKFRRPFASLGGVDRELRDVICERIPDTDYFRSPYLRLVTTEASRNQRPRQTLLLTDFVSELVPDYERYYTEILHQRVEAEALLKACKHNTCGVNHMVRLAPEQTLHLAIHVIEAAPGVAATAGVTRQKIRDTLYRWTRRVLAPAHICPVIEHLEFVPYPENVLAVANSTRRTRGRHASGKGRFGKPSEMKFTVDGTSLIYSPRKGDSPGQTAEGILQLIMEAEALVDYTARTERIRFFRKRQRTHRSIPVDVLVFRPDGEPAKVDQVESTDRFHGLYGGQTLSAAGPMLDGNGHFPVGDEPFPNAKQRALRRTYDVPGCLNVYVIVGGGSLVATDGDTLDGKGPLGDFAGNDAEIGPCVFITESGIQRPLVMAHELGHPLFHGYHADSPKKDSPPASGSNPAKTTELMDGDILDDTDSHDMSRHIADAPIAHRFGIAEDRGRMTLLDGKKPTRKGPPTTPVRRLQQVGGYYGIVRSGATVRTAPDITGMPSVPHDA